MIEGDKDVLDLKVIAYIVDSGWNFQYLIKGLMLPRTDSDTPRHFKKGPIT